MATNAKPKNSKLTSHRSLIHKECAKVPFLVGAVRMRPLCKHCCVNILMIIIFKFPSDLSIMPEAYHLEAYNSGSRLGIFWDPEEPIKIYFLIWIREIINVTRASVEESAA